LIIESMKEEQDINKINTSKKAINKAVKRAKLDDLTPEQRAESKIQYMRKKMIALKEYDAMEKGMEKGMKKGMKKGMEKGMEKGVEKGTIKTKIAVILGLHKNGVAISIIAASLDMTAVEVEMIIKENTK